jgi:hypothetical protein
VNNLVVKPGDIIATQFGIYQHWSVVSDQLCSLGKNMLISATKRTGTVQVEAWDTVVQGKHTYVVKTNSEKAITQILADARSQIGIWIYSVTDKNCEHFAKWSSGLKFSSVQVNAGVGGAAAGATAVAILAENPNALKILGGAVLIAGIAVLAAKALEKKEEESV